jgi:hypothetical protein
MATIEFKLVPPIIVEELKELKVSGARNLLVEF